MVALAKIPLWMTVAEFLAWTPPDRRAWQLVDGVPQAMAPASVTHGAIQAQLAHLLMAHFEREGRPCVVVTAPGIVPRVDSAHNVRIPALAVTCGGMPAEEQALLADPVLVIEILSPSNQAETWANVWAYASIPSVREILVVRSASVGAAVLRRLADGTWPETPENVETGELALESTGFRAPLAALYRTTRLAAG
jgi:Uma2 family endonuclease